MGDLLKKLRTEIEELIEDSVSVDIEMGETIPGGIYSLAPQIVALADQYAQDRQTEAVKVFAEKVKQSLVNSIAKSDNWDYEDIYRLVDRQVKAHLQREGSDEQ